MDHIVGLTAMNEGTLVVIFFFFSVFDFSLSLRSRCDRLSSGMEPNGCFRLANGRGACAT